MTPQPEYTTEQVPAGTITPGTDIQLRGTDGYDVFRVVSRTDRWEDGEELIQFESKPREDHPWKYEVPPDYPVHKIIWFG